MQLTSRHETHTDRHSWLERCALLRFVVPGALATISLLSAALPPRILAQDSSAAPASGGQREGKEGKGSELSIDTKRAVRHSLGRWLDPCESNIRARFIIC